MSSCSRRAAVPPDRARSETSGRLDARIARLGWEPVRSRVAFTYLPPFRKSKDDSSTTPGRASTSSASGSLRYEAPWLALPSASACWWSPAAPLLQRRASANLSTSAGSRVWQAASAMPRMAIAAIEEAEQNAPRALSPWSWKSLRDENHRSSLTWIHGRQLRCAHLRIHVRPARYAPGIGPSIRQRSSGHPRWYRPAEASPC